MTATQHSFPASVVPVGVKIRFMSDRMGIAVDNGTSYDFAINANGAVCLCGTRGLIRADHKLALRAVILAAYRHATRGVDTGADHNAHVKARAFRFTSFPASAFLPGACEPATRMSRDTGVQHDAHVRHSPMTTAAFTPRFEVVFHNPIAGLIVERFAGADLVPAMAEHGFAVTGVNSNPHHRAELQGQPKFIGLNGPMYGGPGVVRYETAAAYSTLSV